MSLLFFVAVPNNKKKKKPKKEIFKKKKTEKHHAKSKLKRSGVVPAYPEAFYLKVVVDWSKSRVTSHGLQSKWLITTILVLSPTSGV